MIALEFPHRYSFRSFINKKQLQVIATLAQELRLVARVAEGLGKLAV